MNASERWPPHAGGVVSLERRRAIFLAGSAALLAACGGPRSPRREQDGGLKQFTERGYTAPATTMTEAHRDMWLRGDEEIVIELLVPQSGTQSPLVVYLPGLGEPVEAGATWRNAWAQAGYAVASLQAGPGGTLWSSAYGRNGDFAKVAREQFAVKSLATWIDRVAFVLQGIVRRAKAGESFYARIDTNRIAVAGFDLGAQTALAFAGEKHPGIANLPAMPELRAVIALSPQAILARGGFAERFGDIKLPTLTITGTEDVDPYGLVDSPHTRQAPFNYMPTGDKYLLVIEDGTHQLMAGGNRSLAAAEDANGPAGDSPGNDGQREPSGGGRGGPGGGRGGMGGPGSGRGGMEGGPGGVSGGRPDETRFRRSAGIGLQRQAVIIERVSVAFLDTVVKDDPVAREWLARDAVRWSDPLARLKMK